ncbi:MAG TPA: DUF5663 domain-containing protein [Candidatus Saccharimonadales bacterium]|nr:DUF5663 domain-containing protein [Candidatus Saccharimonadales bacterium]
MIKLDDDLLQELGLSALPTEEKKKLLAHIYETLEMRVGMKLAERMSDAQLTEFEQFIDRNDEAGALHWLESNFPDYKDVVAAEFDVLKHEIAQVAPQILASGAPGGAAPTDAQQQQLPQQPQQPMTQPQQYQQPGVNPAAPTAPNDPMWQGDQSDGAGDPWQQQQPPRAA